MSKSRIFLIVLVLVIIVGWLLSGILTKPPPAEAISLAEAKELRDDMASDSGAVLVRVRHSTATEQDRAIVLRGRIIDRNQATVAARVRGQVVERPVDIGDRVNAGDVLCEIELADRQAQVDVARDAHGLAAKEYESSLELTEKDFVQELDLARKKAQLSASLQRLLASEIELENTKILAPIAGTVQETHANVGDYLGVGLPCATILVMDPLYAEAFVSEEYVAHLNQDAGAEVTLPTGEVRKGRLVFVNPKADDQSKTFKIEIALSNDDYSIRSGMSASIKLNIDRKYAHKVPTSAIVLNESGTLGLKTVSSNETVEFHAVDTVREEEDGIWVSGLPLVSQIITVGQGLVVEGERVAVELE